MSGFRNKMAEMIAEQGNELWTIEHDDEADVRMWYIKDKASYNDPHGRLPQYQIWKGDKRRYVGTNMQEAYADYEKARIGA